MSLRKLLFTVTLLLTTSVSRVYAQSGPAFSTRTPVSGELDGNFIVSLPIFNTGTAEADNVQVTSATLEGAVATSPGLPVSAGILSPGDYYGLSLQFRASNLVAGRNYLLTVRGTYTLGSQNFGFALNRFVSPSEPTGTTLTELQHWVTLDAMRSFANTLSGVDRAADDQAMLAFIQGRPEFVASGIDISSFSVWAVFANGEEVAYVNDRPLPGSSAAADAKASVLVGVGIPGNSVGARSTTVATQIQGVVSTGAAVEVPESSDVRLMNALPPPYFGDGPLVTDLATILTPQNYKAKAQDPSLFNLMCVDPSNSGAPCASGPVGGDGVFYYTSHGGYVGDGTPAAPLRYGVWTTTKYDPYLDQNVLPTSDTIGKAGIPPTLIKYLAAVNKNVTEVHYAITASFVRKYFQNFSNNSFVYVDACSSDDPRTGPDSAQDFKQAFFDKNASVYAGWTFTVDDGVATDSARLVFDRLLGANVFIPESGPPQRPFPWDSLPGPDGDLLKHKLGSDSDTGAFLEFAANPAAGSSVFGLLAPSISFMEILEDSPNNTSFNIGGVFGSNPGVNGGVSVGGSDPQLPSQTNAAGGAELIACDWATLGGFGILCGDLPFTGTGSYGNVQVSVRGHNSNVARITEWQGTFTFKLKDTGGTDVTQNNLSASITMNTAFRADIRSFRPVIHDPPRPPIAGGFELMPPLSSAQFGCGGMAQVVEPGPPPFTFSYNWTGSGNLKPYDFSSGVLPPKQFFSAGGDVINTYPVLNLTLEVGGSVTECTGTLTTSTGSNSSMFDIDFGAKSLTLNMDPTTQVIQAPQTPLTYSPSCIFVPSNSICSATLNWNSISPVGNSAPNPNAAQ